MRATIAFFVAVFLSGGVHAADFKTVTAKDNRLLIIVTGELSEGDADVFKAIVKSANAAGKLVSNIRLSSNGGNLAEGMKLADAVRFGKISTNVGKDATCASACFLIFAAGETKYANYTAKIGVHGASTRGGEEASDGTVAMARVAKELGVPAAIIGRMVVTPPTEMVWLTPQDLQSMGTAMVGKPAQVATTDQTNSSVPNQTRLGDPIDLGPNAVQRGSPDKRATLDSKWDELIDAAVVRSAEGNGGKPEYVRSCQPEFKICWNGIFVKKNDGVRSLIKVTKDMNDKIIRREICDFNATRDIRKCFDWDKGTTRRDMQNSSGNWVQVADE